MKEASLQEMLRAAQQGDPAALGAIYDRLAGDVRLFLVGLRLGLRPEDLQDAVHEAFLRLFSRIARCDPSLPLRPYLLGIARNVAIDLCRKAPPRTAEMDGVEDSASVVGEAVRSEEADLVSGALAALKPEQRTALALRHLCGLTMEELATSLACSVPTARKRLRDASRLLGGELRSRGITREDER